MLPNRNQWKNWSLPSKYTAIGTAAGILSICLYFLDAGISYFASKNNSDLWYVGAWKVDEKKSMPEFEKQYLHYKKEFGEYFQYMNWPKPEEGNSEKVFFFREHTGQMLNGGKYQSESGVLKDYQFYKSEGLTISGDAGYSQFTGRTSVVTFDIILESENEVTLEIKKHDMRLPPALKGLEIPNDKLIRENGLAVLHSWYFINKNENCADYVKQINCDVKVKFYPTKTYLYKVAE